jgi:hypothetical protein
MKTSTDKLHATRLLTVEEKPFKRLTKRLLAATSPIQSFYSRLPTPPADGDDEEANDDGAASEAAQQKAAEDLQRFREDVILDFAAFESSIARIQFLRASNEKERERYAAEKVKIEATAQAVRDNTARLRIQLDEAQKTLAIRKTYDELADKITNNKALRPRDEQHVNIEKLRTEIEDLERESKEYSQAWVDRRDQFSRIVDEGARLRRLVRDEKEPEPHIENAEDMLDVEDSREGHSNIGTPRPDPGMLTPMPPDRESGTMTPRSLQRDGHVPTELLGDAEKPEPQGTIDTEMADDGEVEEGTPTQQPEKAHASSDKPADQMDVT